MLVNYKLGLGVFLVVLAVFLALGQAEVPPRACKKPQHIVLVPGIT